MNNTYKSRKETLNILGISYPTLYKMADKKKIEVIQVGSRQMYNINKYLQKIKSENPSKRNICYCRVSSRKQKEDLKRQIKFMKEKYPNYEIISDIASEAAYWEVV
ncbi:MAG TPA: hypothetical protein EYO59_11420 [Chromatiaceae bacterium]|nr:hypothetical protein [Chromatiaceae bacterium]